MVVRPLARLLPALVIALLTLTPTAGPPSVAQATSFRFTVNSSIDAPDAHPGDGICADTAGQCTLRAAVQEANALPVGSGIAVGVPTGTYTLTLGSLELLTNTLTISGAGAAATIISGAGASRVALVGSHSTATLDAVTLTGGRPGPNAYGGAVLSAGDLTLRDSVVRGNTAGAGGGVTNSGGTLLVDHSRITDNTAWYFGGGGIQNGGLHNRAGTVTVFSSTITQNGGGGDGGGILNGQNGHPASREAGAVAVQSYCLHIPLCARAATAGADRPAAVTGLPTLPLTLTVVASTIADNNGGNGGGGISNDGGRALVLSSTLNSNRTSAVGGGISSFGSLTVMDSTLSRNRASYGGGLHVFGGGVAGSVLVISSTLSHNTGGIGGGIDDSGANALSIRGSTLNANNARQGGGLEMEGGSLASVLNSTLSGNTAPTGQGGGIQTFACGSAILTAVTLAANSIALAPSCPNMTLSDSIVAQSTTGPNCTGPVTDQGYNLDSGSSCGFNQPTSLSNTNPLLGPLADNGGPTLTMALRLHSPASDQGATAASGCPATDQRGYGRPDGSEAQCDIGAYEAQGSS